MKYRLPYKNEAAEFTKRTHAMLKDIGATETDSEMYELQIETIYGTLRLSAANGDFIAGRFDDRERLPAGFGGHHFQNGKWNHHYSFTGKQDKTFEQLDSWLDSVRSRIYRMKPDWTGNQTLANATK